MTERKNKPSVDRHNEEVEWKKFWDEWSPKLVLHACKHSSGSHCVKVLDEMGCELRYVEIIIISI